MLHDHNTDARRTMTHFLIWHWINNGVVYGEMRRCASVRQPLTPAVLTHQPRCLQAGARKRRSGFSNLTSSHDETRSTSSHGETRFLAVCSRRSGTTKIGSWGGVVANVSRTGLSTARVSRRDFFDFF